MRYSNELKKKLKKEGIRTGDRIRVSYKQKKYDGILMPRTGTDEKDIIILKLDSGYNIGLELSGDFSIEKVDSRKEKKGHETIKSISIEKETEKDVAILIAGGTIASRVDYRTGAVKPSVDEEELVSFAPRIAGIANIEAKKIIETLSENVSPDDWVTIAKAVKKEIENGKDGVVVAHGTDTMGYTAAALSFVFEDLPIPVVLTGSQRSSDRGSSDSHQNLTCAVKAATTEVAEVMVCMHGERSDTFCYLHPGTKTRKMHTSRRDAFRTINADPYAKVHWEGLGVEMIRSDYRKKDKKRRVKIKEHFEENVEMVKIYPGMDPDIFKKQLEKTEGVIVEGTGLGHLPTNNKKIMEALKKYNEEENIAFMASQCLNGRVNMNIYETGIDLQSTGVIGNLNDMLPETAYVKLAWLLGNYNKEEAKDLMTENMRGEITERSSQTKL